MASESKQGGETVDTSGGHVGGFDEFAVGTPSSKAGGARVPRSMQLHSEAVVVARETIMLLVDKAAHQLYLNVLDPYIPDFAASFVMNNINDALNMALRQPPDCPGPLPESAPPPVAPAFEQGGWTCEAEPEPIAIDARVRWAMPVRKLKQTCETLEQEESKRRRSRTRRRSGRRSSQRTVGSVTRELKNGVETYKVEAHSTVVMARPTTANLTRDVTSPSSSMMSGGPRRRMRGSVTSTATFGTGYSDRLHLSPREAKRRKMFKSHLKKQARKQAHKGALAKAEQEEKEAIERRRKALRGREVYMDARADGGLTFLAAPAKAPMFERMTVALDGTEVPDDAWRSPGSFKTADSPGNKRTRKKRKGRRRKQPRPRNIFTEDQLSNTYSPPAFEPSLVFPSLARSASADDTLGAPGLGATQGSLGSTLGASRSMGALAPATSPVNLPRTQQLGGTGSSRGFGRGSPPRLPSKRSMSPPKRRGGGRSTQQHTPSSEADGGSDVRTPGGSNSGSNAATNLASTFPGSGKKSLTRSMALREKKKASPKQLHATFGMRSRPYRERHPHEVYVAHAVAAPDVLQHVIDGAGVSPELLAQSKKLRSTAAASRLLEQHLPRYMLPSLDGSEDGDGTSSEYGGPRKSFHKNARKSTVPTARTSIADSSSILTGRVPKTTRSGAPSLHATPSAASMFAHAEAQLHGGSITMGEGARRLLFDQHSAPAGPGGVDAGMFGAGGGAGAGAGGGNKRNGHATPLLAMGALSPHSRRAATADAAAQLDA